MGYVPIRLLTPDEVPTADRPWVERVLIQPLNRMLDPLRLLLDRGISVQTNMHAQVFALAFTAPSGSDWSSSRFETVSALRGSALGIIVIRCDLLDSAGKPSTPVSDLGLPAFEERVATGRTERLFRLVYQPGLTAASRYRVTYLAWGD